MDRVFGGIYKSVDDVWKIVEWNEIWPDALWMVHCGKIVNDWLQMNSIIELRKISSFRRNVKWVVVSGMNLVDGGLKHTKQNIKDVYCI